MKKTILLGAALVLLLAGWSCSSDKEKSATENSQSKTSNEEMCSKPGVSQKMSLAEAKEIAEKSNCTKEGKLIDDALCNDITGTWWIELDTVKEGCDPACVVDVETKQAEVNWRCTGLLVE